jgi:hypothetical protein
MFQKKIEEEKVQELTEKEIQKLKEKLGKNDDELDDIKIKDLKISDIIPQSYNDVIITIMDGYHTLHLPPTMEKGKFKTWRKSAGGMFSKDVLNFSRKKEHGKYVLIEGRGERKIVRLIEDEELNEFKHFKLVKGIVKDKPYMILKKLSPGEKLTNTRRYIKENSEHVEIEETINITPQMLSNSDDDYDTNVSSVSLFDE